MNERVTFFFFEELGDVGGADFEFESHGDAIEGLEALAGQFLAMLVEVDEAGGDDQAGGVDDAASRSVSEEMRRIFPSRIPTLRTASVPVSGSMTRPPSTTRSYCCA